MELEDYVNELAEKVFNLYETFIDEKLGRKRVEVKSATDSPFPTLFGPFTYVSPLFPDTIFVRDIEIVKKCPTKYENYLIHECVHIANLKVNQAYKLYNKKYEIINEGSARFLTAEIFKKKKEKAIVLCEKVLYYPSIILTKFLQSGSKEIEVENILESYVLGYKFFSKIYKKYGLKEVFKIIKNPDIAEYYGVIKW